MYNKKRIEDLENRINQAYEQICDKYRFVCKQRDIYPREAAEAHDMDAQVLLDIFGDILKKRKNN